jgi:hypothetical protein
MSTIWLALSHSHTHTHTHTHTHSRTDVVDRLFALGDSEPVASSLSDSLGGDSFVTGQIGTRRGVMGGILRALRSGGTQQQHSSQASLDGSGSMSMQISTTPVQPGRPVPMSLSSVSSPPLPPSPTVAMPLRKALLDEPASALPPSLRSVKNIREVVRMATAQAGSSVKGAAAETAAARGGADAEVPFGQFCDEGFGFFCLFELVWFGCFRSDGLSKINFKIIIMILRPLSECRPSDGSVSRAQRRRRGSSASVCPRGSRRSAAPCRHRRCAQSRRLPTGAVRPRCRRPTQGECRCRAPRQGRCGAGRLIGLFV